MYKTLKKSAKSGILQDVIKTKSVTSDKHFFDGRNGFTIGDEKQYRLAGLGGFYNEHEREFNADDDDVEPLRSQQHASPVFRPGASNFDDMNINQFINAGNIVSDDG